MSDTYAMSLPEQEAPLAAILRADAQQVVLALCNRCGRPAGGHAHGEPDE